MKKLNAEDRFKAAMRVLTDFACNRYLMSCSHGRWDGAEKAMRHDELCRLYLCAMFGVSDKDRVRRYLEDEYQAVHSATQALTDNLDTAIGFPLDSLPDYDRLVPLFFERFHELATTALSKKSEASSRVKVGRGPLTDEQRQAFKDAFFRRIPLDDSIR